MIYACRYRFHPVWWGAQHQLPRSFPRSPGIIPAVFSTSLSNHRNFGCAIKERGEYSPPYTVPLSVSCHPSRTICSRPPAAKPNSGPCASAAQMTTRAQSGPSRRGLMQTQFGDAPKPSPVRPSGPRRSSLNRPKKSTAMKTIVSRNENFSLSPELFETAGDQPKAVRSVIASI